MIAKKSTLPLTQEFGQKVFVNGRWIKREETKPPTRFEELDKIIKRGQQTFIEVAEALIEIRDSKLYKEAGYDTFEQCCETQWGFKKSQAYRLIRAREEALKLPEPERPKTERAMRKSLGINKNLSPMGDILPSRKHVIDPLEELLNAGKMTVKAIAPRPEPEVKWEDLLARMLRMAKNKGFLKALKEWLDESGII